MAEKILIFGKDNWPFTNAAREAFAKKEKEVEYFNVLSDKDKLETMLKLADGRRKVPVIVDGKNITIGFKGRSWGV